MRDAVIEHVGGHVIEARHGDAGDRADDRRRQDHLAGTRHEEAEAVA